MGIDSRPLVGVVKAFADDVRLLEQAAARRPHLIDLPVPEGHRRLAPHLQYPPEGFRQPLPHGQFYPPEGAFHPAAGAAPWSGAERLAVAGVGLTIAGLIGSALLVGLSQPSTEPPAYTDVEYYPRSYN